MKNLILSCIFILSLFPTSLFAQAQNTYSQQWKEVRETEESGKTRTAWNLSKDIFNAAKKKGDTQQQIKALIFQLKYRKTIEENADVKNIHEVDSAIQHSKGVYRALLQNLSANQYLGYLHKNRYKIFQRTTSDSEKEEDITTWSPEHFYEKITHLFLQSLSQKKSLQHLQIKDYTTLIEKGKNTIQLRPTLYDVLAHHALKFFSSSESTLTKPAQQFIINNSNAFAPADKFISTSFTTTDTASLSYTALLLYQDLLRFHKNDKNRNAFLDVDIERLKFVYFHAVLPNKDDLYKKALQHIIHQNNKDQVASAYLRLINYYYRKGTGYHADKPSENRWALSKALELCNTITDTLTNESQVKAQRIKDFILKPALSLKAETVNVPGKPFRVLVKYKNKEDLWFRLVKLDSRPRRVFSKKHNLKQYLEEKVYQKWQQEFPLPKDYQMHSAEMKVDELPVGRYALIASASKNFNEKEAPISFVTFSVSDLSYVSNHDNNFLILNRETGKPIKKAKVRVWERVYNSKKRTYELKKGGRYKSDRKGHIQLDPKDKKRKRIFLEISKKKDHLFYAENDYLFYNNLATPTDNMHSQGYLFTDRSIYRPGQKLYLKGLLIKHNSKTEESEILPDKTTEVLLYDANHQLIDSLKVTTNEMGSFSGSFTLPSALMNGRMQLQIKEPRVVYNFNVEEYKRPSYDVTWSKEAQPHRLNDSVFVSGIIEGYNGAAESEATVKYQVTRKEYRFPYRSFHQRSYFPFPVTNTIISNGEIKANASGKFTIPFKALPDPNHKKGNRVYNYEIAIDVTNLSGESHHYSQNIPVGDKSLVLQIDLPEKVEIQNLDSLSLKSTDLQGHFIPSSVAISMNALHTPDRFIRQRYWNTPDQFIMDKKEYLELFPHDEYQEEAHRKNWERANTVYVANNRTSENEKIPFFSGNIRHGWYLIKVMARDRFGQFVTDSQYIQIYNKKDKHIPYFHQILWSNVNSLDGKPGDKLSWDIGSSEKTYVFEQSENNQGLGNLQKINLNHKVKKEKITLDEKDLGGLEKHYIAVRFNRVFRKNIRINVPRKEKKLNIELQTFRNKILPGEKETWTLKITGNHQEKVNAELLAAMYDLSLDNFAPHQWNNLSQLYPDFQGKNTWKSDQSFYLINSTNQFRPTYPKYPNLQKVYPYLKTFGYNFSGLSFQSLGGIRNPGPALDEVAIQRSAPKVVEDGVVLNKRLVQGKVADAEGINPGLAESEATKGEPASTTDSPLPLKVRKDFRETAFFYPRLQTDEQGNISFSFTSPEALTRWKLMLLAHTKDLKYAYKEKEVVTQKPLMIQMNAPRFVRQGDRLTFTAKVSNLSKETQSGSAVLSLENTSSGDKVHFIKGENKQNFQVKTGENTSVSWTIEIPKDYTDALTYTVKAMAKDFSDGEQDILPVLSNQTEITSSLPLHFSGNGSHQITWKELDKLSDNVDIQPEKITLEYTSNPIWYVVQALPFISSDPGKSASAQYQKIYANTLSRYVALKIPNFKSIMQQWIEKDSNALKSPLQKNEELKNVLLEETPWVRNAQSEAAQKALIAHWYQDKNEQLRLTASIKELAKLQLNNGGISWFKGMPDGWLLTQKIITGFGHLKNLHAWPHIATNDLQNIVNKAVPYLDARMLERYQWLQAHHALEKVNISPMDIQYLYMRSFFPDISMQDSVTVAYHYFYKQAQKYGLKQNTYMRAMLALTFHREKDNQDAKTLLTALKETMTKGPFGGLHWKQGSHPFFWYQAPISTQAIALEAMNAIGTEKDTIQAMRNWLLTQKEARYWGKGEATADAVFGLLLTGSDWTSSSPKVEIKMGDSTFSFAKGNAGLHYKKVTIPKEAIRPNMKNITVNISGAAENQTSWGSAYFQYFSNMDAIEAQGSELHIKREISKETSTESGKKLSPIGENTALKVGDKVQVRMVVTADRDMDFVHLKDIRATAMEPMQVISGYRFRDGLGYYSTVTDAAVHFYFQHLPKGTYVLTYPVYITQKGTFTGGISQIESLYAPKLRGHSEGVGFEVK